MSSWIFQMGSVVEERMKVDFVAMGFRWKCERKRSSSMMELKNLIAQSMPPDENIFSRFKRSKRHFPEDYLPLTDEWGLWDYQSPPWKQIPNGETHSPNKLSTNSVQQTAPREMSKLSMIAHEARRVATETMLGYCKCTGIKVIPQITLPLEKPMKARRKAK